MLRKSKQTILQTERAFAPLFLYQAAATAVPIASIPWHGIFNTENHLRKKQKKKFLIQFITPGLQACLFLEEPFEPENQEGLLKLVRDFKKKYPNKTIWCYSGFTIEEITGIKPSRAKTDISLLLLKEMDVLVDGRFEKEKRILCLNSAVLKIKELLMFKEP